MDILIPAMKCSAIERFKDAETTSEELATELHGLELAGMLSLSPEELATELLGLKGYRVTRIVVEKLD